MSSKLLLAFSPHQNSTTLYLTSLAALGSASATLLALSYFKPSNLGQNDLHHNWKSLSLVSGIGGMLTLHYGVTNESVVTSLWKSIKSFF
jgi:hypothetical protein